MATVRKNVLGDLRGKIGNMSARQYKGKSIFASLPSSYKAPMDAQSILRRTKFSSAVKMTKEILSKPLAKQVWVANNNSQMNTYNYLMKTNYRYLNGYEVTQLNQITPITGFSFNYSNLLLNENSLSLDVDPINIELKGDINIYLLVLFQFLEPVTELDSPFDYSMITSEAKPFVLGESISFTVQYSDYLVGSNNLYTNKKLLLSLITEDSEGNFSNFSSTKLHTL